LSRKGEHLASIIPNVVDKFDSLRSKHLGNGFFAWLNPPVPLRPPVPTDVSDAGRSTATDAKLFPSDEQLSQRALFVALLVALGWSVLALAGALPLYMVGTPCHGDRPSPAVYGGGYSTLTDLSLLRLLKLLETEDVSILSSPRVARRALLDDEYRSRTRIIILTAIAIVFGVLPALWKIIKEFNNVAAYRQRWLQVRCENTDLGWLKASRAPGFANWGETKFKEHLVQIGLSSRLGESAKKKEKKAARRNGRSRRREEELPLNNEESNLEVDIHSLFSITYVPL
jgi:calcium permeable stress-gated cation channel